MSPRRRPGNSGRSRYTPAGYRRWLRLRRRLGWTVTVVLLVGFILLDRTGWLVYPGSDRARYDGQTFRVASVTDGDTLRLDTPDGDDTTTRVRLWGIDTPELGPPGLSRDSKPAEPYAQAATDRASQLAFGLPVTLHLEPHRPRDRYGRVLGYITLPDGSVLNERLLIEGLARADDRWPHRHAERYARLEEQARHENRGLWFTPPPGIIREKEPASLDGE